MKAPVVCSQLPKSLSLMTKLPEGQTRFLVETWAPKTPGLPQEFWYDTFEQAIAHYNVLG